MRKLLIFLVFFIFGIGVIYATTSYNPLTKGYADTLYCAYGSFCGFNITNDTIVNQTTYIYNYSYYINQSINNTYIINNGTNTTLIVNDTDSHPYVLNNGTWLGMKGTSAGVLNIVVDSLTTNLDLDQICATEGKILQRTGGIWGCADYPTGVGNSTQDIINAVNKSTLAFDFKVFWANILNIPAYVRDYTDDILNNITYHQQNFKHGNTTQEIFNVADNKTFQYKLGNSSNITCEDNICWFNGTVGSNFNSTPIYDAIDNNRTLLQSNMSTYLNKSGGNADRNINIGSYNLTANSLGLITPTANLTMYVDAYTQPWIDTNKRLFIRSSNDHVQIDANQLDLGQYSIMSIQYNVPTTDGESVTFGGKDGWLTLNRTAVNGFNISMPVVADTLKAQNVTTNNYVYFESGTGSYLRKIDDTWRLTGGNYLEVNQDWVPITNNLWIGWKPSCTYPNCYPLGRSYAMNFILYNSTGNDKANITHDGSNMYLTTATGTGIVLQPSDAVTKSVGHINPTTSNAYDLGSNVYQWRNLYLAGNISNISKICFDGSSCVNASNFTGGSGTPAGASGQIQFNNAGNFGASSNLTWNESTKNMIINKRLGINAVPSANLQVYGDIADGLNVVNITGGVGNGTTRSQGVIISTGIGACGTTACGGSGNYNFYTGTGGSLTYAGGTASPDAGASGTFNMYTGTGGYVNITGNVVGGAQARQSGSFTMYTGLGGDFYGNNNNVSNGANAGQSGGVTLYTGNAGSAYNSRYITSGQSGSFSMFTGSGGSITPIWSSNTTALVGSSGSLQFSTGRAGYIQGNGGAGSFTTGYGNLISFTVGRGTEDITDNGVDNMNGTDNGDITFTGGQGADAGNAGIAGAGSDISLTAGQGGNYGSGGRGGNITIKSGARTGTAAYGDTTFKDSSNNNVLILSGDTTKSVRMPNSNAKLMFGNTGQSQLWFDGTNFQFNITSNGTFCVGNASGLCKGTITAGRFATSSLASKKYTFPNGSIDYEHHPAAFQMPEQDFDRPVIVRHYYGNETYYNRTTKAYETRLLYWDETTYPYTKMVWKLDLEPRVVDQENYKETNDQAFSISFTNDTFQPILNVNNSVLADNYLVKSTAYNLSWGNPLNNTKRLSYYLDAKGNLNDSKFIESVKMEITSASADLSKPLPQKITETAVNIFPVVTKHEDAIAELKNMTVTLQNKVDALEKKQLLIENCAKTAKDFIEYQGCVAK